MRISIFFYMSYIARVEIFLEYLYSCNARLQAEVFWRDALSRRGSMGMSFRK